MNFDEAKYFLEYGDGTLAKDNPERSKKFSKLVSLFEENEKEKATALIKELTDCTDETANLLWDDLYEKYGTPITPDISPEQMARNIREAQELANRPKCIYCGSTNIKRISSTAKIVNVAMFGVFGNKRRYQWHCNNCKSDF